MKCPICGAELAANTKFCTFCGASIQSAPDPVPENPPAPSFAPPAPPPIPPKYAAQANLPPQYKPLGAWAYFGLQLLFSIPLVGFICLIVFSLDDNNINRRNFARSYWCKLIISLAVTVLLVILLVATGLGTEIMEEVSHFKAA